ncbi:hypothetical protein PFISCL1PPCAC_10375, partial [Pristionchus fissidentatus]
IASPPFTPLLHQMGEDHPLSAPSLLSLSSRQTSLHPSSFSSIPTLNVHLPLPVSHALFLQLQPTVLPATASTSQSGASNPKLHFFTDGQRFPLDSIDIALTDSEPDAFLLAELLNAHKERLTQLSIINTTAISPSVLPLLESKGIRLPNLRSFRASTTDGIVGNPKHRRRKMGTAGLEGRNIPALSEEDLQGHAAEAIQSFGVCTLPNGEKEEMDTLYDPITTKFPHISTLNLARDGRLARRNEEEPSTQGENMNETVHRMIQPLTNLQSLDLSYWTKMDDLRCLRPLSSSLTRLILYDVPDLYKAIDNICELTQLRVLDVSQCNRETGMYPRPATCLHKLVTSLPLLSHLDISSTNLAAQPSQLDWPDRENAGNILCDIYGLRFLSRPLDFLGLFNCDSASHFGSLPAKNISGDATEDQVINALRTYSSRAGLLQAVLNESYQLYRFGNNNPLTRHTEALHLVLQAMSDHLNDSTLQIAGSASLFYIIRKVNMNRDTKRRVVGALLSGMETHMDEQVMVRNCCLSLCQFEIPQEILFDYSRLAILLVTVLQHHNGDSLTQRIVVFLLNSMACHVEGDQKIQVGKYRAIEMILQQIKRKLDANVCDDVMEVGWSFLWNITDETPTNCERFLEAQGLTLFEQCFDAFRTERELVRNMMGLIGNIAEVDSLRNQLMKDSYITIFTTLLTLVDDSIEISYNSAGVLAHLVSDGEEAWSGVTTKRSEVMEAIMKSCKQWKLDTRRFINYRSFRPILRLIPVYDAPASQHWAVWALANLTTTDGNKYCRYVVEEGGETLLIQLVNHVGVLDDTKILANIVLTNISNWRNSPSIKEEKEEEGEPMEMG